ncbi:MAG TPA: transcription antitermination factor NusB [Chloroflexota bacterium]|nr:transcription antitermination factor NusB [Chloroflexota bacterium]
MTNQRHLARVLAFQTLFELESRPDASLEDVFASRISALEEESDNKLLVKPAEFAEQLVKGVLASRTDLDERLARIAPAFPVEQIARVDRIVLEEAVYEILHVETPVPVVIDEAVEIAKTYGGDNSSRFVNGVLGTLATDLGASRVHATQPTE